MKNNKIVCWSSDIVEMNCVDYPLNNGLMVNEYDYGGAVSYLIYNFTKDGKQQIISELFIRESLDFEDNTRKCPEYTIDGEEVEKDIFEQERKEKILDHVLKRSSWNVIGG